MVVFQTQKTRVFPCVFAVAPMQDYALFGMFAANSLPEYDSDFQLRILAPKNYAIMLATSGC